MRSISTALAVALLAQPALAQERSVDLHQTLAELAYVLGESHALRQACSGGGDQHWRNRMIRMVDAEDPDPVLDRQIKEGFNAGFIARRSEFPRCSQGVRRAQTAVAAHGRDLSTRLARAKVAVPLAEPEPPTGMADPARAR